MIGLGGDGHATYHGSGALPTMPHVELSQEELDHQYPSLVPPDDALLDDLSNDLHDVVYQKGLLIADAIRSETSLQGRMRRPLVATLTEQQQQRGLSSIPVRASTVRPLGGGVIKGATTLTTTATADGTTTATTATTATTTTTTTTEGGVRKVKELQEEVQTKRQKKGDLSTRARTRAFGSSPSHP